jgi:hypothetical protein
LQQAFSLVFTICCVSEVTPAFIPVVLEGLEAEAREAKKGCGLIRSRSRRGSGGEVSGNGEVSAGEELSVGGVMDRANTGGRIGGSDAMVLCKSTLGLPISSEENF